MDLIKLWAAVETARGYESFNGVGTNGGVADQVTHNFYVRYLSGCNITSENWIEYKCDKYKIVSVENLDENGRFILVKASKHGCKALAANTA
jgi:head-tail adaptor